MRLSMQYLDCCADDIQIKGDVSQLPGRVLVSRFIRRLTVDDGLVNKNGGQLSAIKMQKQVSRPYHQLKRGFMISVRRSLFYSLLLGGVLLASCGGTATQENSEADLNAILTAGVGTLAASIFETQTALAPVSTDTAIPATETSTTTPLPLPSPGPSATQGLVFVPVIATGSVSPTPTGTLFTATPNPSLLASGCNNLLLIGDVNIPAGTVMKPNEAFTKTWKVQNNGTCDWALQFGLVFAGGNQMSGDPGGLGKVIAPQKWTQISVALIAPKQPGTYSGSWRLGTQTGTPFGSTLTVSIVVASPTNTPLPPTNTPLPTSTNTTAPPTSTSTDTPLPTETPIITP